MEAAFYICQYPDSRAKEQLASVLGLHRQKLIVWFQNRRARMRNDKSEEKTTRPREPNLLAFSPPCPGPMHFRSCSGWLRQRGPLPQSLSPSPAQPSTPLFTQCSQPGPSSLPPRLSSPPGTQRPTPSLPPSSAAPSPSPCPVSPGFLQHRHSTAMRKRWMLRMMRMRIATAAKKMEVKRNDTQPELAELLIACSYQLSLILLWKLEQIT